MFFSQTAAIPHLCLLVSSGAYVVLGAQKSLKELTFIVELTWKSNVQCLDSGLKVVWVWEKVQSVD